VEGYKKNSIKSVIMPIINKSIKDAQLINKVNLDLSEVFADIVKYQDILKKEQAGIAVSNNDITEFGAEDIKEKLKNKEFDDFVGIYEKAIISRLKDLE